MTEIIIAGAARTAMGGFQGALSEQTAAQMGGVAIAASLAQAGVSTPQEVLMGCVLPAGQGQAPARQAGFAAGLAEDVPATTLNKMCGSGMKAAMVVSEEATTGQSIRLAAPSEARSEASPLPVAERRLRRKCRQCIRQVSLCSVGDNGQDYL